MTSMQIIVNVAGGVTICAIIWWFWLSKPKLITISDQVIDVLVDAGSYSPARIQVNKGKPITLVFHRKDPSPCAEKVVFDQLDISEDLPLEGEKKIELNIEQSGEYEFTCQMGMYRGTLVVN